MRFWLLYQRINIKETGQRLIMLLMVALLSFFGPLACVLHCTLMPAHTQSAPVLFVCQFGHKHQQDLEQGQPPMPHFSPPGLLPFAQLAIPTLIDALSLYSMLLLFLILTYPQLHLPPPTPPPRLRSRALLSETV